MDQIEIVRKVQKGDDKTFGKLMNLYKEKLYKIAFAYLKNEQNSLDAISETIYKSYININKLKEPQYFNTWIIKILINSCKDILKKNKKVVYIDEYDKIDGEKEEVLETELKIASNIDLYNAIDKLNEKFKSVIILKYLEDMTITQISEVLDFPEGTVKVYLRRALKILKIELGEECM
ncbi:sigma-70 family RNA polymerase sigma factor [Clostridium autoethanogenum]|uniref:Sigma-70 family RNA polymerase sigma factor n=1 Tax=Clostridium autoethanogenum TaxID=84023 RepID=A0A3M0SNU9_9CLOT|nr:sigma-70 family RNA polymerase sigma factor [Clostridium autoethanogenum]RMD00173.1 sigma-70 family RNA polymerase sigma factor [Clostridium autoethanogenum]